MEKLFVYTLLFLAVVLVRYMVKIVRQGEEWTLERFGRYTRTLRPGLNVIIPFFDRIGARVNMKETVLDIPRQEVISKDNAMVAVDGVVFYQIVDASKATYMIRNLSLAMRNLALTNLRTVMGSMVLDDLLSNRDAINAQLLQVIDLATNPWGVKVTRIEVKDIAPPPQLVEAMSKQMTAEREKRKDILLAEGARRAEILRAEGEKQARILKAEGEREAAFKQAEGRERLAQAEAKATEVVSAAIAKGDIKAINYFVADKYISALQAIASAPNQKVLFLPLEAASVIGAIGGIAEIAKEAFAKKEPTTP